MKRFISLLMATLMLVTLLAGCGDNANKDQGSDESTNSVTLRNTGFLTTSDPNQTTNTHEYTVHENIYEGLYDLNEASGVLEPGSSAGLLVYENRWAAPFAAALRRGGGQLVAGGRIPVQAVLDALDATEPVT